MRSNDSFNFPQGGIKYIVIVIVIVIVTPFSLSVQFLAFLTAAMQSTIRQQQKHGVILVWQCFESCW